MQFGPLSLPCGRLERTGHEDDFRGQGLRHAPLAAAERQMAQSAQCLACCGRESRISFTAPAGPSGGARSAAPPIRIASSPTFSKRPGRRLAAAMEGLRPRRASTIQVRPWRRWEEDAVARIYRQNLAGSFGPLERTRSYWHCLLERRAYDHFYVALDGPDLWDLKESNTRVVGYAAIRGENSQLMTVPGRKRVVMEMLARACGDAIEQDQRQLVLHAAADHPALEYFHLLPECSPRCERRNYAWRNSSIPLGVLRKLCPVFVHRAIEAGLARPGGVGPVGRWGKYQLDIAGSGRVAVDTLGRSYLRLNVADFTRLGLGPARLGPRRGRRPCRAFDRLGT